MTSMSPVVLVVKAIVHINLDMKSCIIGTIVSCAFIHWILHKITNLEQDYSQFTIDNSGFTIINETICPHYSSHNSPHRTVHSQLPVANNIFVRKVPG